MKRIKMISVLIVALTLCLVGCASLGSGEPVKAEANYSLVGYDYVFQLDGDTVQFKFMDIFSTEEIEAMAAELMTAVPNAVEYSYPQPGNITIKAAKNISEADFAAFVEKAEAMIYSMIY